MILRAVRVLAVAVLSAALPALAAPSIASQVEEAARAQLEQQAEAARLTDPRFELTIVPPRVPAACSTLR